MNETQELQKTYSEFCVKYNELANTFVISEQQHHEFCKKYNEFVKKVIDANGKYNINDELAAYGFDVLNKADIYVKQTGRTIPLNEAFMYLCAKTTGVTE